MRKPPTAKGKVMPEKVFTSQKIRKPEGANKFETLVSSKYKQVQKAVQDRQSLVKEYRGLNKSNKIVDRRSIEDPKVATKLLIENKVKLLPAATKRSKKLKFFELDSDDEVLQLTHKGKKIDEIDDFKNEEMMASSGEEDGRISGNIVDDHHFSGFYEPGKNDGETGERKKTRQEIFTELIHKSKKAKFERQQLAMENQIKKEKINEDFQSIRHLLVVAPREIKEESKKKNLTDDYYSMADMLRDDTKVKPEVKVSEDPKKRDRPRKNAKMVDENEEEEEDSDEKEENDFEGSDMGDDSEVNIRGKIQKGKFNQMLKNEKKDKKRVQFVDEIKKMKKQGTGEEESDSIISDEEDEFDIEDDEDGSELEEDEDGQFDEEEEDDDDS